MLELVRTERRSYGGFPSTFFFSRAMSVAQGLGVSNMMLVVSEDSNGLALAISHA